MVRGGGAISDGDQSSVQNEKEGAGKRVDTHHKTFIYIPLPILLRFVGEKEYHIIDFLG